MLVEFIYKLINLVSLIQRFVPEISMVIPLSIQLRKVFPPLLFYPCVIFKVMYSFLIIEVQLFVLS